MKKKNKQNNPFWLFTSKILEWEREESIVQSENEMNKNEQYSSERKIGSKNHSTILELLHIGISLMNTEFIHSICLSLCCSLFVWRLGKSNARQAKGVAVCKQQVNDRDIVILCESKQRSFWWTKFNVYKQKSMVEWFHDRRILRYRFWILSLCILAPPKLFVHSFIPLELSPALAYVKCKM